MNNSLNELRNSIIWLLQHVVFEEIGTCVLFEYFSDPLKYKIVIRSNGGASKIHNSIQIVNMKTQNPIIKIRPLMENKTVEIVTGGIYVGRLTYIQIESEQIHECFRNI